MCRGPHPMSPRHVLRCLLGELGAIAVGVVKTSVPTVSSAHIAASVMHCCGLSSLGLFHECRAMHSKNQCLGRLLLGCRQLL